MTVIEGAIKGTKDFVADISHNLRPGGLSQYFTRQSQQFLPNGLIIDRSHAAENHILSTDVSLSVGWLHDPEEQKGMAHLVEHLLFRSMSPRARELMQKFEQSGGTRNGHTSALATRYSFQIPAGAGNERLMHQLILEFVFNPEFSEEDTVQEKEIVLNEIKGYEDNNGQKFGQLFSSTAGGTPNINHEGLGSPKSLYGISLEDIRNFHKRAYIAKNATVSVQHTGDAAKLLTNIKSAYSDLPTIPRTISSLTERPYVGGCSHLETQELNQTTMAAGFVLPQMKLTDKKSDAMSLIFCNYLHQTLYATTRDDKSMLYSVSARREYFPDLGRHMLMFNASTRPERAQEVLPIFAKVLSDFNEGKVDAHRFNSAIAVTARDLNIDLKREPEGYAKVLRDAVNIGARAMMHERKTIYISPQDIKQNFMSSTLANPPTLVTAGNIENVQSYDVFRSMLPRAKSLENPTQTVAQAAVLKAASSVPG